MSTSKPAVVALPFGALFAEFESRIEALGPNLMVGSRTSPQRAQCERTVFVSPRGGEGTTTLSACSAVALARSTGQAVIWLEGNVFQPSVLCRLGADPRLGIASVVEGRVPFADVLERTDVPGLSVVGNGVHTPGEARLPTFVEWQQILDAAAAQAAHVVVDCPPLLTHPGARPLVAACTRSVLVARAGKTLRRDLVALLKLLRGNDLRVLGSILNHAR